jgi:hypothetical protein
MRALAIVAWLTSTVAAAPRDFTPETRAVYAVAACGEPAPKEFDTRMVAAHCAELTKAVAQWRKNWFDKAKPWLAAKVDKYPKTVVYPFGGGDLVTLLSVYPDATEYTSLSLEGIGDPRPVGTLGTAKLTVDLGKLRKMLAANLNWAWNTTVQLSIDSSGSGAGVPGILTIALVALDAHGYEPVEARYFTLAADGSLGYLTDEELAAWDKAQGKLKRKRPNDVQQGLFNNIEITFRKKGDASAPKKTFRHIAADLSDKGLAANPAALAYLTKRGDLAAMTKAASYLLWKPEFEKVRTALLSKMKIMVSDDTGVPPRYAKPAGFTQTFYGTYAGAFFDWAREGLRGEVAKELVAAWKDPVEKTIPFRFGYYDSRRVAHLMITKK